MSQGLVLMVVTVGLWLLFPIGMFLAIAKQDKEQKEPHHHDHGESHHEEHFKEAA